MSTRPRAKQDAGGLRVICVVVKKQIDVSRPSRLFPLGLLSAGLPRRATFLNENRMYPRSTRSQMQCNIKGRREKLLVKEPLQGDTLGGSHRDPRSQPPLWVRECPGVATDVTRPGPGPSVFVPSFTPADWGREVAVPAKLNPLRGRVESEPMLALLG